MPSAFDPEDLHFRDKRERTFRFERNEVYLAFEDEDAAVLFRMWLHDVGREQYAEWVESQKAKEDT